MKQNKPSPREAEDAVRTLLRFAGEDANREGLRETPARVVRGGDRALLQPFVDAAGEFVAEGCTAMATRCGFLARWQRELQAALPVPVWSTALLQMAELQARGRRCGVITIEAASLQAAHFEVVGPDPAPPVEGITPGSVLHRTLLQDLRALEETDAQRQVPAAAQRVLNARMASRALSRALHACARPAPASGRRSTAKRPRRGTAAPAAGRTARAPTSAARRHAAVSLPMKSRTARAPAAGLAGYQMCAAPGTTAWRWPIWRPAGRLDLAHDWSQRAEGSSPGLAWPPIRVAALALQGRLDEAGRAWGAQGKRPAAELSQAIDRLLPCSSRRWRQARARLEQGLALAAGG
jgi:hypothetical protein